jgi:DHA2 family lincomycin resistance protein-like MFS transporter
VTTTSTDQQLAPALSRDDRKIIATLLIATFVVILNETIMGVAIPRLVVDLGITTSVAQWLSTAFMLTMAVVIPTTGFLLQRLSRRTVFILAMGLFSAGTAVAAASPGFWMLLFGRIVQACGTAIMLPLLMTTILTLVPKARRGQVMGNVSIAISVAPAIGPTISGVILQYLSWRFMFVLVLPIAVASLIYGARGLKAGSEPGSQPLDIVSVLLTVPAFGGVVFGLTRFGESSGGSGLASALVPLGVGVVCLVAFVWRQIRLQSSGWPLLDLRAFSYPMFRTSVSLLCITMIALFGVVILLPIYLQNIRGLGSLQTGLILFPGGLLMGLLAPTVGKIFDRYGPRALTTTGAVLLTVTLWRFSTVDAHTPVWLLVTLHLILSLGLACLFTPAFTSGLNPLPPSLYSHGSAILSTLQQVAGAAGVALLVTILAVRTQNLVASGVPPLVAENAGINTAFAVASMIGIVAVILALFMRNPTPSERHQEMVLHGGH